MKTGDLKYGYRDREDQGGARRRTFGPVKELII
jgi:hypothetical protein